MHVFQVPQLVSSANALCSPALNSFQSQHRFLHIPSPLALITSEATLIDLEGFSWTKTTTRVTLCILVLSTGVATDIQTLCGFSTYIHLGYAPRL